jgi:hypothetical protein
MTLKGFCANNEAPALVNALAPDIVRISWGAWLANLNNLYGATKFLIDLSDIDAAFPLNATNYAAVAAHPSFGGLFLLGNEPDLTMPPAQYWDESKPLVDAIANWDASAKFIGAGGTHVNPIYAPNSWHKQWWDILGYSYRKKFAGFHVHWYNNPMVGLSDYLPECDEYRAEMFPNKKLWLTEVGRKLDSPNLRITPAYVNAKCAANNFEGWTWYAEQAIPNTNAALYNCLVDAWGGWTVDGVNFLSV